MNQVIIEWHDQFAILSEETDADMYDALKNLFPMEYVSQEDVEKMVYKAISNLPYNHYGKLEEQTEVRHKIIF